MSLPLVFLLGRDDRIGLRGLVLVSNGKLMLAFLVHSSRRLMFVAGGFGVAWRLLRGLASGCRSGVWKTAGFDEAHVC